ncbi:F0F1 ATP synthase subunit delta [Peptostreptococcus faecalis]|uniref:F0F1 ATP synthase subunit delta n=1 Tax=Peptostreptococcus faecalis TaxID=2045015 RepID=UPI000C7E6248|nr:F0F1 ATP synthase subunit delta [Peptostreptococcus faecalis]
MTSQIGSRYAQALFELADEQEITSQVYSEILDLENLIDSNESLYDALRSPFVTRNEKKNVMKEIVYGKVSSISYNFFMVLIENTRTSELSDIVVEYKTLLNDKNNILEGTVTSAIALSSEDISKLETKLSAMYNKKVVLTNKIDKDILGGVLVRIGNEEIDGSVKSRLDDLKQSLFQVIS